MKIEILGAGCAKCNNLTDLVNQVVDLMKIEAEVEHVTDMGKILNYGIMMTPALIVEGKTKCVGRVPSADEIKNWISEEQK